MAVKILQNGAREIFILPKKMMFILLQYAIIFKTVIEYVHLNII